MAKATGRASILLISPLGVRSKYDRCVPSAKQGEGTSLKMYERDTVGGAGRRGGGRHPGPAAWAREILDRERGRASPLSPHHGLPRRDLSVSNHRVCPVKDCYWCILMRPGLHGGVIILAVFAVVREN